MRVVSKKRFEDAKKMYPNCITALDDTFKALSKANPSTPTELKQIFPSLDNFKYVDKWYVIDISGNHLRLIAFIEFEGGQVYVKNIVTHSEYDRITQLHREKKIKR